MNKMIWCLLLVFSGCTTKRKFAEQSVERSSSEKAVALQQSKAQALRHYATSLDSSATSNSFKIYPKGSFTLSRNGFVGNADSIVWHGNMQQSIKLQQGQRQNQMETQTATFTEKEQLNQKQAKSIGQRFSFAWWPWWLSVLIVALGGYWLIKKRVFWLK